MPCWLPLLMSLLVSPCLSLGRLSIYFRTALLRAGHRADLRLKLLVAACGERRVTGLYCQGRIGCSVALHAPPVAVANPYLSLANSAIS